MYRCNLACALALAFLVSRAPVSAAAEPTKPRLATPAPQPSRRLGVETTSQADAREVLRAKLDISKGEVIAPAAGGAATVETLVTMLENMGYEPKLGEYTSGSKYLTVSIPRGTWTFGISIDLSGDKSTIWLSSNIGEVKDQEKIHAPALLKLLEGENAVWPSFFTYVSSVKCLYVYRPLKNVEVKPALLRSTLDAFMNGIETSGPLWDQSKWTETATAEPAKK